MTESPKLSLLGAYERDNFGDVLFLEVTRHLLGGLTSTAAAPLGAHDGFKPIGLDVERFENAARENPSAGVWVVGGEVGGTSMRDAYRMAASSDAYNTFSRSDGATQFRTLTDLTGRSPYSSPYVPRMSATPETLKSRFVINSAGLSGLGGLVGLRRTEAWTAVTEAGYISVRDTASSDVLKRNRVNHVLAPDLIHTLRHLHPEWKEKGHRTQPRALVQVKEAVLRNYGAANFAETLLRSRALDSFEISLFVAGSARGHDSVELYEEVASTVEKLRPGYGMTIIDAVSAMEKAHLIATSDLWVGTSLHGLIISSSFEIPRVGLELPKLTRYASTWDEPMPMGVKIEDLDLAVNSAMATEEQSDRADTMATSALESFEQAKATILMDPVSGEELLGRQRAAAKMARRSRSRLRIALTDGAENLRAWRRR